jgi:tetratricopeptide (TPR) repeat protein
MSLISQITSLFTSTRRDERLLLKAIEHAKAKRPAQAMAIYNQLIESDSTSANVRAKALFNRALAHSSLKDDPSAIADLEKVLAMPGLPDNVQSAARAQLLRVRKRSE